MSYNNPNIPIIENLTGLDKVIQDIQIDLSARLPWLAKSFGRAWTFQESDAAGKVLKVPKCYSGSGEYINVLPNDNLTAQSFIAATQPEKWEKFNSMSMGNSKIRSLAIYFWGNLKKIDKDKDYIFTEELKNQIEKVLIGHVDTIVSYYDEKAEQVFSDYSINDVDTQYLMYPFFACRFDVTVKYYDSLC
jgi:hypothetical protein